MHLRPFARADISHIELVKIRRRADPSTLIEFRCIRLYFCAIHIQSELILQIIERRIRLARRLAVRLGIDVRMTREERSADIRCSHHSLVLALGELVTDDAIGLFRLLARARKRRLLLLCQRGRLRLYRFSLAFLLLRWYIRDRRKRMNGRSFRGPVKGFWFRRYGCAFYFFAFFQ